MEKLFTVELTKEKWTEVIIAMDRLAYSRKVYEHNEKKANLAKDIEEIIQNQITMEIISAAKKESR